MPESLQVIDTMAFEGCPRLSQTINIPASLKLEGNPFLNTPVSYTVSSDNKNYADFYGSLYSKDYHTLIDFAENQTELRLPARTRSIAEYAFAYCELENINIPEQITEIGANAFYDCNATTISLPNTISVIKDCTFYDCNKLKQITIPPSVSTIYNGAFLGCRSLESVVIPETVTRMHLNAFYGLTHNNFKVIVLGTDTEIVSDGVVPAEFHPTYYAKGSTYSQLLSVFNLNHDKVKLLPEYLMGNWGWAIGPNSRYSIYYTFYQYYEPANGLQFDISMPEGLSVEKFLATGQGIQSSWAKLSDGRYRVIAYAEDGAILPTDARFDIAFSSDERLKRSEILFHNIIFSIAGVEYSIPDEKHYVSGYDIVLPKLNEIEDGDSFELPNPLCGDSEGVTYTWVSDNTILKIDENNVMHALRPGETQFAVYINDPNGDIPSAHRWLTVTPALWGDADGNGSIDIADVVATLNHILERNPEQFNAKLADVDRNGRINIVDLTAIVKPAIAHPAPEVDENSPAGAPALSELAFSEPVIDAEGRRHISLEIEPSADYTALQTDIELPEGATVESMALADAFSRHTLDYAAVSPTTTRVVIYSPSLDEVAAGKRTGLIDITISASDDTRGTIRATRALACDAESHSYTLAAAEAELKNTTGLSSATGAQASARAVLGGIEVTAPQGMPVRIVDLAGRIIADYSAPAATRFHALAPGVYTVSFEGGNAAKVLVK